MATYAFPMNGSATHASHGHGQIGTQHRKAAPERISLRPTSMIDLNSGNESSPWNGRFESAPPPHENAQVRPSRSLDNTRNAFHHHLHSSNNLPFPTLDPIKSENVTPIEMDHEFGIPSTHLRAQEDGYGFFPNTKHQRAVSSAVHTPPR
ncbi:hypothetical protein MMC20_003055 [Loxospora ochrophaea]|nr:hypothetical protein [Loxospora ochrophaea]